MLWILPGIFNKKIYFYRSKAVSKTTQNEAAHVRGNTVRLPCFKKARWLSDSPCVWSANRFPIYAHPAAVWDHSVPALCLPILPPAGQWKRSETATKPAPRTYTAQSSSSTQANFQMRWKRRVSVHCKTEFYPLLMYFWAVFFVGFAFFFSSQ